MANLGTPLDSAACVEYAADRSLEFANSHAAG